MQHSTVLKFSLVAGFIILSAGLHRFEQTSRFVDTAVASSGVVVELAETSSGDLKPVVEYTDHTGTERTLYVNVTTTPPQFVEGERVSVLYDPADPLYPVHAQLNAPVSLWGLSLFLVGLGITWMLVVSAVACAGSRSRINYFDAGEAEAMTPPSSDIHSSGLSSS